MLKPEESLVFGLGAGSCDHLDIRFGAGLTDPMQNFAHLLLCPLRDFPLRFFYGSSKAYTNLIALAGLVGQAGVDLVIVHVDCFILV